MFKRKRKRVEPENSQTCQNCATIYTGKICNNCGEHIFNKKQLSADHYLHEAIDFFYHFESKVLKTIKLNILKPGFITAENLKGIRIPYAKPVQLYLVVALVFILLSSKLNVRDYIPGVSDHHYTQLSDYPLFFWAKPLDQLIVNSIDNMWRKKAKQHLANLETAVTPYIDSSTGNLKVYTSMGKDSFYILKNDIPQYLQVLSKNYRNTIFDAKVATYSKVLMIIVIPLMALIFMLFFSKQLQFYGSALILSTHFMVYNLCFFAFHCIIDIAPRIYLNTEIGGWLLTPIYYLLFETKITTISIFLWGSEFELLHFIFWSPWLFITFKRLFTIPWWKNILFTYCTSKIFYFIIYGVFKKILIAFTMYMM